MSEKPVKKKLQPPSNEQFLQWKRSKVNIHWQLLDGSTIIGSLNWFDNWNVSVHTQDMGDITLPKHAILWYRSVEQE